MTIVLIAVDATDTSVHAVETAHRLFGDDAEYLVLNVGGGSYVPVPDLPRHEPRLTDGLGAGGPIPAGGGRWPPKAVRVRAISDTEAAETIAKQTGEEGGLADATALGMVGDAAGSIIDVAVAHAADVIVVGTKERGGWRDCSRRRSPTRCAVSHRSPCSAFPIQPRPTTITDRGSRPSAPPIDRAMCRDVVDARPQRRLGNDVGDLAALGVVVHHVAHTGEQRTTALDQFGRRIVVEETPDRERQREVVDHRCPPEQ